MTNETPNCKICGVHGDMIYDGLPAWCCQTCGTVFDDDMNTIITLEEAKALAKEASEYDGENNLFVEQLGETINMLLATIRDRDADIQELTGQRVHDEDLDPDKYIGPSYPNGEPSGPYIS